MCAQNGDFELGDTYVKGRTRRERPLCVRVLSKANQCFSVTVGKITTVFSSGIFFQH